MGKGGDSEGERDRVFMGVERRNTVTMHTWGIVKVMNAGGLDIVRKGFS